MNLNKVPPGKMLVSTCDMHTAGEPLRIIVDGYPQLEGSTLLAKRDFAKEHLDEFRRLLMFEPRGHYDMYGAVLTEPDDRNQADVGVLFMQNEGYSTMCGHAVIALGRFLVDRGLVVRTPPVTTVRIQCPCGVVKVMVDCDKHNTSRVRFHSVNAFAFVKDKEVDVQGKKIIVDIAFGGAFYAILPASRVGLDVQKSPIQELIRAATTITESVQSQIPLYHPESPKLAFLYGTILTDGCDQWSDKPTSNICVFAKAEVDRSPTGSGVTARMALQHSRGQIGPDQKGVRTFLSVLGGESAMTGRVVSEGCMEGGLPCVTVEVAGRAYYTGCHQFMLEEEDPFPEGFTLR